MSSHKALHRLLDEARLLTSFLELAARESMSPEALIDRHLDFRSGSAQALREITDEWLQPEEWALDGVLERLESELRSQLSDLIPLDVIVVRRYGATHRKLYEYLWRHRGRPVPASRLRVLTGDQVHTERRVRELRDVGLRIDAVQRSGQNVYELVDEEFDVEVAMRRFVPTFVASVRHWSPAQRQATLERLGLG